MTLGWWRITLAVTLTLLVAVPLAWPVGEVAFLDDAALTRLPWLARSTAVLVFGVLALTMPVGVFLAVVLERTDVPGRRLFAFALLVPLFLPLPIIVSGWQALREWLPATEWTPWSLGMGSAILLHSLAALPWAVLITGLGLRSVERELEEDALTVRPALWVLVHVTLRRALPAIAAAALCVAVQVAGEITITDLMQVRTLAEEVYVQLVGPELDGEPIGRAVAAALLGVSGSVLVVVLLARHVDRPPAALGYRSVVITSLGRWKWPMTTLVVVLTVPLVAVPVVGLVWRAGLGGVPATWSLPALGRQLLLTSRTDAWLLLRSPVVAGLSGVMCAGIALVACWLARESRPLRIVLLVLMATAWAMPGPLVGLGLKGVFHGILDVTEGYTHVPRQLLWDGPSSVPLVWVNLVRFLPYAMALLWPAVRQLPRELLEAARIDGTTPWRELVAVVWPLTRAAFGRAAVAVAILSLGELSAGKLVSTPEAESFAEVIWTQMHYGLGADLAAKCLLLLVGVVAGALGLIEWRRSDAIR